MYKTFLTGRIYLHLFWINLWISFVEVQGWQPSQPLRGWVINTLLLFSALLLSKKFKSVDFVNTRMPRDDIKEARQTQKIFGIFDIFRAAFALVCQQSGLHQHKHIVAVFEAIQLCEQNSLFGTRHRSHSTVLRTVA